MSTETHQKVTAAHLARDAYLYVRQSSLRQVMQNTESTKRQYALRERAVALGWPIERIHTIDRDLGRSGVRKTIARISCDRVQHRGSHFRLVTFGWEQGNHDCIRAYGRSGMHW